VIGAILILSWVRTPVYAETSKIPISHVIVIVQENHSFDNYFGTYPGANGLPLNIALPSKLNGSALVKPFPLQRDSPWGDICHSSQCSIDEYDGGKMDGFVYTAGTNLTMGYFDYHQIPYYWDYASQFVLMDNYYSSVRGASVANHLYLVAGQSGGMLENLRNLPFTFPSVIDELEANHVSWSYYAQPYASGWNPLPNFKSFVANATLGKGIKDTSSFPGDVAGLRLQSVSWIMPRDAKVSEHPPQNVPAGQDWVVAWVNQVMKSEYWNSTAIFITWDDYGGWYDHVPPPQVDKLGYGFRVPSLIISPYARHGFIDHTQADHTSILKFIETLFGFPSVTTRDANAANLFEAFDFSLTPLPPLVLPGPYIPEHYPISLRPGLSSTTTTTTTAGTGQATSGWDFSVSLIAVASSLVVLGVLGYFGRRR